MLRIIYWQYNKKLVGIKKVINKKDKDKEIIKYTLSNAEE